MCRKPRLKSIFHNNLHLYRPLMMSPILVKLTSFFMRLSFRVRMSMPCLKVSNSASDKKSLLETKSICSLVKGSGCVAAQFRRTRFLGFSTEEPSFGMQNIGWNSMDSPLRWDTQWGKGPANLCKIQWSTRHLKTDTASPN